MKTISFNRVSKASNSAARYERPGRVRDGMVEFERMR